MNRRTMSSAKRADLTFPLRVKIKVPPRGLGPTSTKADAWLNAEMGADGWGKGRADALGHDAVAYHFRSTEDLLRFLEAFPELEFG